MNIRTSLYAFMLFALSAFALSGCGGGGGGSSTPPQTAIPLTTSDIRIYKQGDMLTATLTLRDTASGETASGDVTITVGAIVQNPFGIDCRSVDYSRLATANISGH